jgi:hypothetical protein
MLSCFYSPTLFAERQERETKEFQIEREKKKAEKAAARKAATKALKKAATKKQKAAKTPLPQKQTLTPGTSIIRIKPIQTPALPKTPPMRQSPLLPAFDDATPLNKKAVRELVGLGFDNPGNANILPSPGRRRSHTQTSKVSAFGRLCNRMFMLA